MGDDNWQFNIIASQHSDYDEMQSSFMMMDQRLILEIN